MDNLQSNSNTMNDAATSAPSEAKPAKRSKPAKARLSPEDKIAALELKQNQLAEQIKDQKAKITAKNRKEDTRRKIITGAIALEHMEHDPNFKNVMTDLLKKHVKESDLKLFEF